MTKEHGLILIFYMHIILCGSCMVFRAFSLLALLESIIIIQDIFMQITGNLYTFLYYFMLNLA